MLVFYADSSVLVKRHLPTDARLWATAPAEGLPTDNPNNYP